MLRKLALERQDLPCAYLAYHEPESAKNIIVVIPGADNCMCERHVLQSQLLQKLCIAGGTAKSCYLLGDSTCVPRLFTFMLTESSDLSCSPQD